jgi:AraC-like DNA-binding protein
MSKFPECRVVSNPTLIAKAQKLIQAKETVMALCGINTIIYSLCYEWLEEKPKILQREKRNSHEYETLLDFVEKHGDAQTTVGNLAKMKKMRPDVFSRKFTRDLGISPKDFINSFLIRKASRLLSSPSVTVKETAYSLNFNSEYYFSRFFKLHTGIAPSEFRHINGTKNDAVVIINQEPLLK